MTAWQSISLAAILVLTSIGAADGQQSASPVQKRAGASAVVQRIMSKAQSRWYSQVSGISRIRFEPATNDEVAEVKALGEDAIPALEHYIDLQPRDDFTQLIAVRFLTEIGSASALPALKKALSHDQWEVTRAAALDGMFIISPSEARSYVAAALTDGSAVVRQHARNLR